MVQNFLMTHRIRMMAIATASAIRKLWSFFPFSGLAGSDGFCSYFKERMPKLQSIQKSLQVHLPCPFERLSIHIPFLRLLYSGVRSYFVKKMQRVFIQKQTLRLL